MLAEFVRRLSRPPVIAYAGREWPALFTHAVLLDLEERTGLDVLNGGLDLARPRARDLRDTVHVLLTHAGASALVEEIAGLCGSFAQQREWRAALIAAWRASTPDPKPVVEGKAPAPQTWPGAWAIADQRLHLAPEQWLAMTPRLVHALLDEYLEALREQELMQSKLVAAVINFAGMGRSGEAVKEEAFMVHPWPASTPTPEDFGAHVMSVFAGLRGAQEKRKRA